MTRFLAIDPGTRGAFCGRGPDGEALSLPLNVCGPKGEHPGARLLRLREALRRILFDLWPDAVVYEQGQHWPQSAIYRAMGAYYGVIELVCAELVVPVLPLNPAEWQAWAVPPEERTGPVYKNGRRKLTKDDLAHVAQEHFGAPAGLTQDEYEARLMLAYAEAHHEVKGAE